MQVMVKLENAEEALRKLAAVDNHAKTGITRALYRIGAIWKKTAVEYAPISPTTNLLQRLQKNNGTIRLDSRHKNKTRIVTLTRFYADRLPMLLSKDPRNTNRPMPGGLMRSISMRSDSEKAEVFVPSNAPGGKYAAKIHDERGSKWRDLGPGSQAKGPQAREKFILRAFVDRQQEITMMVSDEMNKAIQRAQQ
jgi:hypothetical protein